MSQGKQQRLCAALMKEAEISVQQCSKQQENLKISHFIADTRNYNE